MNCVTTLNEIWAQSPCDDGWDKLLDHLGKTEADDEPLSLLTILGSNGITDAAWCLQAVNDIDCEARLFAVWCARQVQHLMTDPRSIAALDIAERYANDEVDASLLFAASTAAWLSSLFIDADKESLRLAHLPLAKRTVRQVAWDAARSAAYYTTLNTGCAAAYDTMGEAARAAANENHFAVSGDPDAMYCPEAIEKSAAWSGAWSAARAAQEAKFIEMFCTPTEEPECTA